MFKQRQIPAGTNSMGSLASWWVDRLRYISRCFPWNLKLYSIVLNLLGPTFQESLGVSFPQISHDLVILMRFLTT